MRRVPSPGAQKVSGSPAHSAVNRVGESACLRRHITRRHADPLGACSALDTLFIEPANFSARHCQQRTSFNRLRAAMDGFSGTDTNRWRHPGSLPDGLPDCPTAYNIRCGDGRRFSLHDAMWRQLNADWINGSWRSCQWD
eukprot:Opistho-2@36956